jgi:hypothetical protein
VRKAPENLSGNPESRVTDKPIDEAEARRILENLARNGPPTAQVASIKVLRDMDKAEAQERAARETRSFEELHPELYEDEV